MGKNKTETQSKIENKIIEVSLIFFYLITKIDLTFVLLDTKRVTKFANFGFLHHCHPSNPRYSKDEIITR